jgi:hypothetical protein
MAGENGSSGESKFAMVQGSGLVSGGSNAVTGGAGGMSLHGASGGAGAGVAEYNLMAGLGKQSKSREQGQGQHQHQHQYQGAQHGGLGGGKGMEGATSQGFSVSMNMAGAMNSRGASVGPGPLGLAPVAAVMAPQGHAMIQSMGESGRGHPQGGGSGHVGAQMGGGAGHSSMMQQQQQQQHQQLMQLHHVQQQQRAQAQAQAQAQQLQQQVVLLVGDWRDVGS